MSTTQSARVREFMQGIGGMTDLEFAENLPTNQPISGGTVESQADADERIPGILSRPGPVIIWAELTGYVDFTPWLAKIDWLILSGSSTEPTDLDGLRRVIADYREAGVKVWVRSIGKRPRDPVKGPEFGLPVGATAKGFAWDVKIKHPTGSDPSEWPAWANVREVPKCLEEE